MKRIAWWRIFSWQLYDFADTIYSMNVLTLYIGLYLMDAFNQDVEQFSRIIAAVNLVVAVTSPALGALSDASRRRLPFLRFFAIATFLTTALIGYGGSLKWAVTMYLLSYFCYQSASTFYQALLPGLCDETNVSRVSGYGVALGYVGSIFGVMVTLFTIRGPEQYPLAFLLSGVFFFLFAIPCLTVVPDFAPATVRVKLDIGAAYRRVADTLSHARTYPGLFRFLIADFIYENAVAAVITIMAVFSKKVVGFTDADLQIFFILSTVPAVIGGYLFSPLVDKIGPKKSTLIALSIWFVVFPLVALSSSALHIRLLGPLAGIGLATIWIASRTYLVALAPVKKSGEFFGLYALSGKSAGVLGLFVWALALRYLMPLGEAAAMRASVWVLWLFIVGGLIAVFTLPDVRPTRANILDRSQPEA